MHLSNGSSLHCTPEPPESDNNQDGTAPSYAYNRIKLVFEPDAYYTDLDLIISLTKAPIPQLGEMTESEIYRTLLSRAALLPQFLVLENKQIALSLAVGFMWESAKKYTGSCHGARTIFRSFSGRISSFRSRFLGQRS